MNKAPGMNQIAAKFQEEVAFVLAYLLPKIIHFSIKLSIFSECKFSRLKPLFKKGSNQSKKLQTYFTSASSVPNYWEINTLPNAYNGLLN